MRRITVTVAGLLGVALQALAVVAVMLLVPALLMVLVMRSIDFDVPERAHLQPIPIDVAACPGVAEMHEAANRFQSAQAMAAFAVNSDREPVTWPEARRHLDEMAAELDWAITSGLGRLPPEVQLQLTIARDSLREGRAQLSSAGSHQDLLARTDHLEADGQLAFGYADDLVGRQCPTPLRADSDTLLGPFSTSSVPKPTPATRTPSD